MATDRFGWRATLGLRTNSYIAEFGVLTHRVMVKDFEVQLVTWALRRVFGDVDETTTITTLATGSP